MRIIKLGKNKNGGFLNEAEVAAFFDEELYSRNGRFGITRRKRNMPDVQAGTLFVFSYQTHCMYVARSAGPVKKVASSSNNFDPKWPANLLVDMDQLEPVDVSLHELQEELLKKRGVEENLVGNRGWPFLEDKHEKFVLKSLRSSLKPQQAIQDIDVPMGNNVPDRAMSSHWSYVRDPKVRAYVLRRARGRCEYCNKKGFLLPSGQRFLETHHIIALANEGADTPENVIALCPNHHREVHYGDEAEQAEKKMIKIARSKQ